jgi:uracil-DNA glycosylase family 4
MRKMSHRSTRRLGARKHMASIRQKLIGLAKLNRTLKPPRELPGSFQPQESPRKFEFMFVAEMPSMAEPQKRSGSKNFNFGVTARDKFLQDTMRKYGVGGSYITDVVKKRDVPRRPTAREIKRWLPFLLKEIDFVNPKAIVVLGKRTFEKSFLPFVRPCIPERIRIDYVFHYSTQVPRKKFETRFAQVVRALKRKRTSG